MRKVLLRFLHNQDGQALVEFVLMLVVITTVTTLIAMSLRKSLIRFWRMITREVAAGCPDCSSSLL